MIWIIPAAVAASVSFFKLGTLSVWVQVLAFLVKAMLALFAALIAGAAGLVFVRIRRRRV